MYIPELLCKNRNTSTFSVWAKYCNSQQLLLPVLVSSHRDFRFCPFPKCLFYGCPTLGEDTESERLWSDIVLNVTWHSIGSGRQCHVNMNYSCLTPTSMDNWQVSGMWFEAFNTVLINQHLNTTCLPGTRWPHSCLYLGQLFFFWLKFIIIPTLWNCRDLAKCLWQLHIQVLMLAAEQRGAVQNVSPPWGSGVLGARNAGAASCIHLWGWGVFNPNLCC